MASIRNAPLYLLPFLSLTNAIPMTSLLATTSILVPREVPNYGECKEPFIKINSESSKLTFQPTDYESFSKDFGAQEDFYLVAQYICAKIKDGCGPSVPPETVQTCWDSYGRASELTPDPKLPELAQWQQRVDKFNNGMKGNDGISPNPNPNPNPNPSDHYEIEIWAGPSILKLYPDTGNESQFINHISQLFSIKSDSDFETKTDVKFAAGCTISTQGYTDKSAEGPALTNTMKQLLFSLISTDALVRHGSERKPVRCNGWLEADGSCCYTNKKDPATGKCPDGYTYRTDKWQIFPTELSVRATIEPNKSRGSGFMKWRIDCGKAGLPKSVWKKDCDWCQSMGLMGSEKVNAEELFSKNLGGIPSSIKQECNKIPCQ